MMLAKISIIVHDTTDLYLLRVQHLRGGGSRNCIWKRQKGEAYGGELPSASRKGAEPYSLSGR